MCAYCPAICANVSDVRTHSDIHKSRLDVFENPEVRNSFPLRIDITDLSCTICGDKFKVLNDLKTHLSGSHCKEFNPDFSDGVVPFVLTGKEYRCVHCDVLFEGFMSLFVHMNKHYQSYICHTCGKGYSGKHKLRAHQMCHESGQFPCPKCAAVFPNRVTKNRHISTAHGPKERYRCPVCDAHFDSYHSRLRHLDRTHGQKAEYRCSLCPSVFGSGSVDLKLKWKPKRKYNDHRDNAAILIESSNMCPFRWKRGAFTCAFCPISFGDFGSIRDHALEHPNRVEAMRLARPLDNVKVEVSCLRCELCLQLIKDVETLKDHLLLTHNKPISKDHSIGITPFLINEKDYLCTHCGEHFELFSKLNTHMNHHYPNNICFQCGKAFSAAHRLKAHLIIHEAASNLQYKCSKCNEVFSTRAIKNSHMALAHGPEYRYRCPYCNDSFLRYADRAKHLKVEHNTKVEYPCHLCKAVFAMCNQRTKHIQQVHIRHKQFFCALCPYQFVTAAQLRNHMVKHIGERKYQCQVCKKSYARTKTLREHMRIHNNDKRFVCEICNNAYVQKCSLQSHIRTHHPNAEPMKKLKLPNVY